MRETSGREECEGEEPFKGYLRSRASTTRDLLCPIVREGVGREEVHENDVRSRRGG